MALRAYFLFEKKKFFFRIKSKNSYVTWLSAGSTERKNCSKNSDYCDPNEE
jgi:hypothetical protein